MIDDPRLSQGLELFNSGEFFEAHEVWEELWQVTDAPERLFLQSLIQAAVTLYHWERGNSVGAHRLFSRGHEKASKFPPDYLGILHAKLWEEIRKIIETDPAFEDRSQLPRIKTLF